MKASCCGQGLALCRGGGGAAGHIPPSGRCPFAGCQPSRQQPSAGPCPFPMHMQGELGGPTPLAVSTGLHEVLVQRALQLGCFSSMKIPTLCFLLFTDVSNRGVQTSQAAAKPAWWEHKTGRGPPDTCLAAKLLGLPRLQDGECDPLGVKEISQMTAKQVFVG